MFMCVEHNKEKVKSTKAYRPGLLREIFKDITADQKVRGFLPAQAGNPCGST
jgi:hypothetical protein